MWENFGKLRGLTLSKASTRLKRIDGEMPRKPSKVSRPNKQRLSTVWSILTVANLEWWVLKNVEASRMSTTTACEIDLEKLLIRGNETLSDVNRLSRSIEDVWWWQARRREGIRKESCDEMRFNQGGGLSSILIAMRHETLPILSKPTMTCAALPPRWLSHFKSHKDHPTSDFHSSYSLSSQNKRFLRP
jgi:hypothetical protein